METRGLLISIYFSEHGVEMVYCTYIPMHSIDFNSISCLLLLWLGCFSNTSILKASAHSGFF